MTAEPDEGACSHCRLPLGRWPTRRDVHGEPRRFCCYGCCLAFQVRRGLGEESEATWLLIRFGVGGFFAMNVMLLSLLLYSGTFDGADQAIRPWVLLLLWLLASPVLLVLGGPFIRDAVADALRGRLGAASLIALGASAAYGYSAISLLRGGGEVYFDTATMLLLLFTLGRTLEAMGRARAVRSLAPLLEAEGLWATVVENGAEFHRRAGTLSTGALVRVRPGERVAVDGIVLEGDAHLDESVITGESRRVARGPGDSVVAGAIVLDGPLLLRAETAGSATRWARICRSVRGALARRSPIQRLADRAAGLLVPLVLLLAAVAVALWARVLPLEQALLIGLAVLVVACPCGLGLAAPLAGSLGIGRLARRGILVRSGAVLEALGRVRAVAFDKTGTLTLGRPRLVGLESEGLAPDDALALAAGLERHAEHRLARGLLDAAEVRGLSPPSARRVTVVPGRGLRGEIDRRQIEAGSARWMAELGRRMPPALRARAAALEAGGGSLVYLARDGLVCAVLAFEDAVRPEARDVIAALRARGLAPVLLTGDRPEVARQVAVGLGMADWQAGLTPEAKLVALEDLRRRCGPVAMVGDGLNDGPVLPGADVGFPVGSATDLARETADLVLPEDGLRILPWAVGLACAVRRTLIASLAWVAAYNLVALGLATAGLLQPIFAAALMAGSSLLVVLSALRLEQVAEPRDSPGAAAPEDQPKMSAVKARYQLSA